jgi:hypothetical protein
VLCCAVLCCAHRHGCASGCRRHKLASAFLLVTAPSCFLSQAIKPSFSSNAAHLLSGPDCLQPAKPCNTHTCRAASPVTTHLLAGRAAPDRAPLLRRPVPAGGRGRLPCRVKDCCSDRGAACKRGQAGGGRVNRARAGRDGRPRL